MDGPASLTFIVVGTRGDYVVLENRRSRGIATSDRAHILSPEVGVGDVLTLQADGRFTVCAKGMKITDLAVSVLRAAVFSLANVLDCGVDDAQLAMLSWIASQRQAQPQ